MIPDNPDLPHMLRVLINAPVYEGHRPILEAALREIEHHRVHTVEALRPFAQYAEQMSKQWTQRDDCVFYGVKREGARQITYGDWRRAARALTKG